MGGISAKSGSSISGGLGTTTSLTGVSSLKSLSESTFLLGECSESELVLSRSRLPLISSSTSLKSCSAFRLICGSALSTKASNSTRSLRLALSTATFSPRFSNLALCLSNFLSLLGISKLPNILSRANLLSPNSIPCAITGLSSGGGVLPTECTSPGSAGGTSGSTSLNPELEGSDQNGFLGGFLGGGP